MTTTVTAPYLNLLDPQFYVDPWDAVCRSFVFVR